MHESRTSPDQPRPGAPGQKHERLGMVPALEQRVRFAQPSLKCREALAIRPRLHLAANGRLIRPKRVNVNIAPVALIALGAAERHAQRPEARGRGAARRSRAQCVAICGAATRSRLPSFRRADPLGGRGLRGRITPAAAVGGRTGKAGSVMDASTVPDVHRRRAFAAWPARRPRSAPPVTLPPPIDPALN